MNIPVISTLVEDALEPITREFYTNSLKILNQSGIPYLVGGAFALNHYTGVNRHTHDMDLFVRKEHCQPVLDALAANGYKTEITFSHWLAKAYNNDVYIDVIFSSGNAAAPVDEAWFEYSNEAKLFGQPVRLCPIEEMIWSKSFVMERERFDGADVAHLLQSQGHNLNWPRLLARYGDNWQLLLTHLTLFLYIYPAEKAQIDWQTYLYLLSLAAQMSSDIGGSLAQDAVIGQACQAPEPKLCQGTLLSREQYLIDLKEWSYVDARLEPVGNMTAQQVQVWTEAIAEK
jgi:hypothetical protein